MKKHIKNLIPSEMIFTESEISQREEYARLKGRCEVLEEIVFGRLKIEPKFTEDDY